MKKCHLRFIFLFLFVLAFNNESTAQVNNNTVWVNGYTKSNGTFVEGHYRTAPNNTINDNFSTYPNVNPYTGVQGTIDPEPSFVYPSSFNNSGLFETPTLIEPATLTPSFINTTITPVTTPSINIWSGGGFE